MPNVSFKKEIRSILKNRYIDYLISILIFRQIGKDKNMTKDITKDITKDALRKYKSYFKDKGLIPNQPQLLAMDLLADIHTKLILGSGRQAKGGVFAKLFSNKSQSIGVEGLYLWGEVGRGKTLLMDLFYENLNIDKKTRKHFLHFMKQVHLDLKKLAGVKDPLKKLANNMAKDVSIICFDEFIVTDVADAMILGGLFTYLFDLGVTIICTSNVPPDRLYEDGLQRAKFLPAIAKIKQNMVIFNLNTGVDYRKFGDKGDRPFYWQANDIDKSELKNYFLAHSASGQIEAGVININSRKIKYVAKSGHILWFKFGQICGAGRSAHDYIELANSYHTIILEGLESLSDSDNDAARRFIQLVDEWYDRGKTLLIYAKTPMDKIYTGSLLEFEFQRTSSRLIEMQRTSV